MADKKTRALVVLSGGQDSTTCLHWAKDKYDEVGTVTFNYGQKHSRETECAQVIAKRNNIYNWLLTLPNLSGDSPLVSGKVELGKYETAAELPGGIEPTFVPGRNLIFLAYATNIAAAYKYDSVITGVCEEDFGGYPDCRDVFIKSLQQTVDLALENFDCVPVIETPLMNLTKKETVEMAVGLGSDCMRDLALSHTCYDGTEVPCLKCHACVLRIKGFGEAGVSDPLLKHHSIDTQAVYDKLRGLDPFSGDEEAVEAEEADIYIEEADDETTTDK